MSQTAIDSNVKTSASLVINYRDVLEFIVVCALSIVVSAAHLYVFKGPNLTLLFDGFGFLTTSSGCMSIWNSDTFRQVLAYCASGFNEANRTQLLQHLEPAKDVVRTGPLIPLLLGCAYTIAGKAPIAQFWSVATWSMWITQSLTIGSIWLACRIAFNSGIARLAAAIALLYPAFILNSNRIASETQACLAITLTTVLFLFYSKTQFRNTKTVPEGLVAGLVLGFLALARPPFLLLPILLVVAVWFLAKKLNAANPFNRNWIIGVVCGGALFLSPWALCNQILTGKPSITIDRFAAYNLYTGLHASSLGFDDLPSRYVEHPGEFGKGLSSLDLLKGIIADAERKPVDFVNLVLLKPVRLLDSHWNDYQNSCLGVPWLLQRYAHQFILCLAMIGLFALWNRGLKLRTIETLSVAILFTLIVSYNLIHCLFISMARYTYPIMPVVIVLAAWGISCLVRSSQRNKILVALVCAPLPTLLFELGRFPPQANLASLALWLGMDTFVVLFAILPALTFLLLAAAASSMIDSSRNLKLVYIAFSVGAAFLIAFASDYGLKQLAFPLDANSGRVKVTVPIKDADRVNPEPVDKVFPRTYSWLLVLDPIFEGFSLDAISACRVSVNGTQLSGSLYPFMGADYNLRSAYVYQKAFAHSGQQDISRLHQWYCISVPANLIKAENEIEIWRDPAATGSKLFIMSDLLDSSGDALSVDKRRFSWTKGFTINPPLDMRLNQWIKVETGAASGNIRPRVELLSLDNYENFGRPFLSQVGDLSTIEFADQALDKKNRMVSLPVPAAKLTGIIDGIRNGAGNAVCLRVSGHCASDSSKGKVSLALVTNTDGRLGVSETMAPIAPEYIECGRQGRNFAFVDIVPCSDDQVSEEFAMSTRLFAAGQAWWDVLQYGSYRIDAPVKLTNLKIEASLTILPETSGIGVRNEFYGSRPIRK
jgi:hypothetical protein